jgi:acyl-CoA synthetase (AMP-forming)/AMP-acid ligase II
VWPEAVEAILATHLDVADVMVRGVTDDEWGQIVEAVVIVRPGSAPTLDDLRAHVKATHPAFMAPRRLVQATSLPRTSLGKLRRSE